MDQNVNSVIRETPEAPHGPGGDELVAVFTFTGSDHYIRAVQNGAINGMRRAPITNWGLIPRRY